MIALTETKICIGLGFFGTHESLPFRVRWVVQLGFWGTGEKETKESSSESCFVYAVLVSQRKGKQCQNSWIRDVWDGRWEVVFGFSGRKQ